MEHTAPLKIKKSIANCVRLNDVEQTQIEEDSALTGKSIPTLLKERYFKGPRPLPLMSRSDLQGFSGEMGRIGNNLNQLARRLNSGIREGFVEELTEIQKSCDHLLLFMSSHYCRCKKT